MPKYKSPERAAFKSDDGETLPHSVASYLSSGASEGSRNHALYAAASQLRDIDMPLDDAKYHLAWRAGQDGLKDGEITRTIESAYAGAKREAPRGSSPAGPPAVKVKRPAGRSYAIRRPADHAPRESLLDTGSSCVPIPDPVPRGFEALLLAAFEEGEGVCVGGTLRSEDGSSPPDGGVTLSREKWLERVRSAGGDFSKVHTGSAGHYIRLNPMRIGGANKNEDATALRHTLVEFDLDSDGRPIPKARQFGAILASGLPVTALIDSGNKSIHAWVRVDAETLTEYKERCDEVYSLFAGEGLDEGNHNANRYSRCPDGMRKNSQGEVVAQRLLKVGLGASDWTEWKRRQSVKGLGERWNILDDLEDYPLENDPNNVLGDRWMCRGGSFILVSQSGIGKSSLQMQLACGWVLGRPEMTFGIKPVRPLKQLVIQAENDQGDTASAWRGTSRGFGMTYEDKKACADLIPIYRVTTKSGDEFIDALADLVRLEQPDLCWIDPLLNFFGGDIGKGEDVAHFCVGGLNRIAAECGVVWGIVHHTGKPKERQYGQTATDAAYSVIGSSVLTNWARDIVSLDRINTADPNGPLTCRFECTKRRKLGGMESMLEDGDTGETERVSQIWVRHADDGTIRWVQCPEPEQPEQPERGRRGKGGQGGQGKRPQKVPVIGRPSALSNEQKFEIVATAAANGGKLPANARTRLAAKFDKSARTIERYLRGLEERAALSGRSVDDEVEHETQGSREAAS